MSEKMEDLEFGGGSCGFVAEHFPGNDLIAPSIWLGIGSGHIEYDRDYGTETPITGMYDLDINEMRKLLVFLGEAIDEAAKWKRPARLHEFKPKMEGVSDSVLEKWINDGKAWIIADGSLIVDDISGLTQAVRKDMGY